jgi:hypothetical protein
MNFGYGRLKLPGVPGGFFVSRKAAKFAKAQMIS